MLFSYQTGYISHSDFRKKFMDNEKCLLNFCMLKIYQQKITIQHNHEKIIWSFIHITDILQRFMNTPFSFCFVNHVSCFFRMGRWETSHVSAPPLMSTIFPNSFLPSKKTGRPVPVPPGRW
jgi:hypothetical protein